MTVHMTWQPRHAVIAGTGALVLLLAACGGSSDQTSAAPQSVAPSRGQRAPQGAFGTIAAVTASNVEVQNPQNGQVTVNFNSSTTFADTNQAALQDVTVGVCVTVTSASSTSAGQPVAARTVEISQPTGNTCQRGGFGQGSGSANPSRQRRPGGQRNGGPRGAMGSVTAVNGSTFTVHETNPGNSAPMDTTVTVDPSTTYTKTVAADVHALAVGKCAVALGPADDTGAVTARSITISAPGPNGCPTLGGRGQLGQNSGGGNG
jgi:hypothetical protein